MNNNKFRFIDLFSGIGGFRIALTNIGGECLNFSEINKDAINTYCTNFNESNTYNLGDISKIEKLPAHDLLTAGVPCQSWSIAGKNLGFNDDRGQLWNDTIYLLNQSRPKAFIFENVKGLGDPRNKEALNYILNRIKQAGYFADYYVLNSFDYGVPQNRVRIYIVGFLEEEFHINFKLPKPLAKKIKLGNVLTGYTPKRSPKPKPIIQKDLFGNTIRSKRMSLSNNNGFNDYFLFNDIRNGHSTIHSWDIIKTTDRQKHICYLLLKNRRKSIYGCLDGNPLALKHFQKLDPTITQEQIDELVRIGILKPEEYAFSIKYLNGTALTVHEKNILDCACDNVLIIDQLKNNKSLKIKKTPIAKTIKSLQEKNIIACEEIRYDFKNTKISTGLFGVSRVFLPSSSIFPTLVASGTNDYVTTTEIQAETEDDYKSKFMEVIYNKGNYRKITKKEACKIQGFPENFILPENRARWMKLLGNSVSVPVIEILGKAILETGVFALKKEFAACQSATL
ncbi:MAG TPA: DNA (cytosine-5-)-methyltransferase [Bacteroidetes bacterium]|nr:DNA (cytosine-5-)-methyltransferase [Bacteroidota bacterium]